MTQEDWSRRRCTPCEGGVAPMTREAAQAALADFDAWELDPEGRAIARRFEVKGFARAMQLANVAGWIGEREGHHPDVRFGWGYCEVRFTTHAAGGLTENDLICAAKLDLVVA